MHSECPAVQSATATIQEHVQHTVDNLLSTLPSIDDLSAAERRGIIGRYSAVLEGNFIYWMTGAYLAARSEEARSIILENLHEEVRDCHPGMLREFAMAARAVPLAEDAIVIYRNLSDVRLFVGRLAAVPMVIMMAFFEGFIQRFMPYLAELAQRQGSAEMEYTDVHGVCDVAHTRELYRALEAEMALTHETGEETKFFEGVVLLAALIRRVIAGARQELPIAARAECQ